MAGKRGVGKGWRDLVSGSENEGYDFLGAENGKMGGMEEVFRPSPPEYCQSRGAVFGMYTTWLGMGVLGM
jgi:hypothetical protein